MLILTGILAFLQMTLLPALLVQRLFRLRGGLLERLIYWLPLSLIINYLLIFLLTALHLYLRPLIFLLIALELMVLAFLWRKEALLPVGEQVLSIRQALRRELNPQLRSLSGNDAAGIAKSWLWLAAGAAAFSALLWALHVWRLNFGSVFSAWDTLFSWNAYAENWAANRFPNLNGSYPQLVSANWSLSYLLTGNLKIQLFNTLLPPLFFLWIFLMLFDLGFQNRESGYFLAAIIARYMMKKLAGDQLLNGYMDVPAACMTLLTLYTFLKGSLRDTAGQKQALVLGCLFAAGAGVTKQAGLIAVVLSPFLIRYWLPEGAKSISRRSAAGTALLCGGVLLPWYLMSFISAVFLSGHNRLVDAGIIRFNQQYEWSHKLYLVRRTLGKYAAVLLFSLLGLPLVSRKIRLPFFFAGWPIVLIWGLFFAYDSRNLIAALPAVAVLSGMAVTVMLEWILTQVIGSGRGGLLTGIWLTLILLALLSMLYIRFPDEKLKGIQFERQHEILGKTLNQELLFDVIGDTYDGGRLLTDYPAYFISGYENCCDMVRFDDAAGFERKLANPRIHYLLVPQRVEDLTQSALDVLHDCLESGRCLELRCSTGYYVPYCIYSVTE